MNESWRTSNEVLDERSKSTNTNLLKEASGDIVNNLDISTELLQRSSRQDWGSP